jgi:hypothetical protein
VVGPEVDKGGLFNEIAEGQVYPHNDKWYSHLLDQYKLYVEMADRISSRRATANSYFLSVNSAILAFVGYLTSKDATTELWLLAVAGVTLSYLWHALILSYSNLNTAKWLVVHQIEKRLPISPYDAEWEAMGRGKIPKLYKPITHIERAVPFVFMALHGIVLAKSFNWCWLTLLREPPWPGCH